MKFSCFCVIYIRLFVGIYSDYFPWTTKHPPVKEHIFCPDYCHVSENVDECCMCNSKHRWELANSSDIHVLYLLDVEYTSVTFTSILTTSSICTCYTELDPICNCTSHFNAVFQGVLHSRGQLRHFPSNLCDFPKLTTVDFSYNSISVIPNISCLHLLDSLNLENNKITHLSNTSFVNLNNLRNVNLKFNCISKPDINLFSDASVGIFDFDISHNNMKKFDITNMFIEKYDFCLINVSSNNFDTTDWTDFYLNLSTTYNSGDIDFRNVATTTDPLYFLSHKQPDLYYRFFIVIPEGKYYLSQSPTECNCVAGSFIKLGIEHFKRFRYSLYDFYEENEDGRNCSSPDHLKGINMLDIFDNETLLDQFVCNITGDDLCPQNCTCIDESNKDRILIDCRYKDKIELPKYLPESKTGFKYVLLMDNNNINTLYTQSYFSKLQTLKVTSNNLKYLSNELINKMHFIDLLNISQHSLVTLSREIQKVHIDKIYFGHMPIPCDCSNLWIGEWRRLWKAGLRNPLFCKLSNGDIVLADYVTEEYLYSVDIVCERDINMTRIALTICLIALVVVSILLYYFRYEILIIAKKMKSSNNVGFVYEWDCFVSFDDGDRGIRDFVLKDLLKELTKNGYKVFIPCIDLQPGGIQELDIRQNMSLSKCFLFILSENYSEEHMSHYNIGWDLYRHNPSARSVILLNFDNISLSKLLLRLPRYRTLKRFSHYMDVIDRQKKIFDFIHRILGQSLYPQP